MIIVGSIPPFPAHATQTPCNVARPILCCSFGCVGASASSTDLMRSLRKILRDTSSWSIWSQCCLTFCNVSGFGRYDSRLW